MPRFSSKSLIFRISLIVLLVQSLVLIGAGYFYFYRVNQGAQLRLDNLVSLPGRLLQSGSIQWTEIADEMTMRTLLGKGFLSSMIVNPQGRILYSSLPDTEGKDLSEVNAIDPDWFRSARVANGSQIATTNGRIMAASKIRRHWDTEMYTLYVSMKSDPRINAKYSKKMLVSVVLVLSLIFSSIALIVPLRFMVTNPLVSLREEADAIAGRCHGSEQVKPDRNKGNELEALARSFSLMRGAIRQKIAQLQQANQELDSHTNRLEAFVQAMPDVVVLVDEHGIYHEALASSPENGISAA